MRKVISTTFLSLDGVMQDPSWTMPYWNDEIAKYKGDELFESDALLLGRVTYEGFAAAWPGRTDEQGFADRMNSLPKYVVSATLETLTWNNSHLIRSNVAEEVAKLKQQDGANILIGGSATLIQTLLAHGLIDEVRLLVYPVILGSGKRLFRDGDTATLKLVVAKTFDSVVALTYQPAG